MEAGPTEGDSERRALSTHRHLVLFLSRYRLVGLTSQVQVRFLFALPSSLIGAPSYLRSQACIPGSPPMLSLIRWADAMPRIQIHVCRQAEALHAKNETIQVSKELTGMAKELTGMVGKAGALELELERKKTELEKSNANLMRLEGCLNLHARCQR